jgi:predicted DNA-binding transcriptional regulator YafY
MAAPSFQRRLVRALTVLQLIEAQPAQWSRTRLARHFGVSARALDHDLRALRQAGYTLRRRNRAYVLDDVP